VLDPCVKVGEARALGLRREARLVLASHHVRNRGQTTFIMLLSIRRPWEGTHAASFPYHCR
jgi:hypothetical protein